jgi:hypothetical protein
MGSIKTVGTRWCLTPAPLSTNPGQNDPKGSAFIAKAMDFQTKGSAFTAKAVTNDVQVTTNTLKVVTNGLKVTTNAT